MSKRHRVTARKPTAQNPTEPLSILFSDLVIGSTDKTVELESCIPFSKIRPLSSSGVQRLISSFLGSGYSNSSVHEEIFHSGGFALGSDMPMVVQLEGALKCYVYDHFKSENMEGDELEERVRSRKEWYGIVDGLHSHAALTTIKNSHPKWFQFKWYVKVLNGGYTIEQYRQLGRVQNARHHPYFYVQLTLFDVLYNLRVEHESLKRDQKKCGGSETAQAYDGAQHAKNSTLQQKANIAIRLPLPVLEELGKIMNLDRPDIKLKQNLTNKNSARTESQLMQQEDCRVFRSFLNINTLKGSSAFMNAKGDESEQIQISALHRAKDLYLHSSMKTIKAENLTSQFKLSNLAHLEQTKFLKFIEGKSWPNEMNDLRDNLLNTTMFDDQLEENSNNELSILPKLLDAYRRHFPDIAALKEAKWQASIEIEETVEPTLANKNSEGNNSSKNSTTNDSIQVDTEVNPSAQDGPPAIDHELNELPLPSEEDKDATLKAKNIYCYNMTWSQYLSDERNDTSPRFDLLLTRPPYAPSRSFIKSLRQNVTNEDIEKEEIDQFCKFIKRVMKSAGYIVLLVHFSMFREWYEALDSHGFLVMPDEFVITYNPSTVKRRKLTHFTQSAHDIALIAKFPGTHPTGFMPPFYQGSDEDSKWTKFHSLLTNVPALKSFLTKEDSKIPFDTREFNPDIFQEFIEIFTPLDGAVIDPFSRTMTTGLACLRSNRSCHLIEKGPDCFKSAVRRLRTAAQPLPSLNTVSSLTFNPLPSMQSNLKNGDGIEDMEFASHQLNEKSCAHHLNEEDEAFSENQDATSKTQGKDPSKSKSEEKKDRESTQINTDTACESTISAPFVDESGNESKSAIETTGTSQICDKQEETGLRRALRKRFKRLLE